MHVKKTRGEKQCANCGSWFWSVFGGKLCAACK
jgi:hypothetical protein